MADATIYLGAPTEVSVEFLQGMANRMATSHAKYGCVADAYPSTVDAIGSAQARIARYLETGNTEYLMDGANFLMIEFMFPAHPSAHFASGDSDESPGRALRMDDLPPDMNNRDLATLARLSPKERIVYIAGPMTGIPEFNAPAFFEAEERWTAAGWKVINPARHGFEHNENRTPAEARAMYMPRNIADVMRSNAIAVLPGWQKSEGALVEVPVARVLLHPVYDAVSMAPIE